LKQAINLDLFKKYRYQACFIMLGVIYLFNLQIPVMDIDAAQYASISREMMDNQSYLQVYHHHADYLDKPPLLFWLSSASMSVFGVNSMAHKLPAILILILGIYSLWRFALLWYDAQRARLAALVFASCQAMFLMTNDVRTDGLLTAWVIFAIWQLSAYLQRGRIAHLLWAALGCGAAMLAKGPIALIVIAFAIGGDLLIKRKWRAIIQPQWLLFVGLILIILLPMCYGLYMQYDLHPEKEVYGLHGPSGLRFFFWTQSFGRITGDIYWDNGAGPFYFLHTILWDFQPWIFVFIPALFIKAKDIVKLKLRGEEGKEYISFFGFVLAFAALSASHYKLPHYIFVIMPFASVLTADYIYRMNEENKRWQRVFTHWQSGLMGLYFIGAAIYFIFCFPPDGILLPSIMGILLLIYIFSFRSANNMYQRLVYPTLIATVACGLLLSTSFYPHLLSYQSGSMAGIEISKRNIAMDKFYGYRLFPHSADFYANRIVPPAMKGQWATYTTGTYIYTDSVGLAEIKEQMGAGYKVVNTFDDFRVTSVNIKFLMKKTRATAVHQTYLLEKVN
jgi:4-amino-4-deoxy-L-arabinose transferase-like glycosyltransferase